VILKSETYHFHRLDHTRQTGFIVTVYDEDGFRLAETMPASTPAEAFREARKIVDNKSRGTAASTVKCLLAFLSLSSHCDGARISNSLGTAR